MNLTRVRIKKKTSKYLLNKIVFQKIGQKSTIAYRDSREFGNTRFFPRSFNRFERCANRYPTLSRITIRNGIFYNSSANRQRNRQLYFRETQRKFKNSLFWTVAANLYAARDWFAERSSACFFIRLFVRSEYWKFALTRLTSTIIYRIYSIIF